MYYMLFKLLCLLIATCFSLANDLHIAAQVLTLISTLAQVAGTIVHIIQECHKAKPHLVHWVATFFSLSGNNIHDRLKQVKMKI